MSYAARDFTNVTTWHRMRSGDPLVGLCGATTNPNPNDCGLTNQNGAVNCPRCIEAILLQTPNTAAQNRPAVTNSPESPVPPAPESAPSTGTAHTGGAGIAISSERGSDDLASPAKTSPTTQKASERTRTACSESSALA